MNRLAASRASNDSFKAIPMQYSRVKGLRSGILAWLFHAASTHHDKIRTSVLQAMGLVIDAVSEVIEQTLYQSALVNYDIGCSAYIGLEL